MEGLEIFAGNIPQMMVSLVREVFPRKISRKNPRDTPDKCDLTPSPVVLP